MATSKWILRAVAAIGSLAAILMLPSCEGTRADKPHVYPGLEEGVDPKPWNRPSDKFDSGATSFPESR